MNQRTCEVCGEPLSGRQARFCCKRHARRAHKAEARARGARWAQNADPETRKVDLTCAHCGRDYRGHHSTGRGRKRTYCSTACLAEDRKWLKRTNLSSPVPWRDCEDCGLTFFDRSRPTQHCSECRRRRDLRVWYMGWCANPGCTNTVVNSQLTKTCSDKCHQARSRKIFRARHGRLDEARKRARYFGVPYEPISRGKVFERDGYRCGICGGKTKREAKVPHPRAPTVDHIVPMSRGGGHLYINVQCACFECNWRKGDGAANDQLRLVA